MAMCNQQYKQKFGFPFVICARENKKEAILSGLERRLNNSKETEAITSFFPWYCKETKLCYSRFDK
jgi:2-oxo-4-hydroxy-4-carboxy--5-ureidoimidazoline (OHCU) decarboxylase